MFSLKKINQFKYAYKRLYSNKSESHSLLRNMISDFVRDKVEYQSLDFNTKEKFNIDLFKECGNLGILGLTAPTEYGGSGMDASASCVVHEELSYSDPAFCLSYLAHSLLCVNNLSMNGNKYQKEKYLPDLCKGVKIGGMGMSEHGFGTDVLGMQTNYISNDDYYILNGTKMWITNGCIDDNTLGDIFLVYAKNKYNNKPGSDMSLFIVEKGMKGFSLGQKIKNKCGMRASPTAELIFENVRIPKENIIGIEGNATLCMMRNLEIERLALSAMGCGIARRCIDTMVKYSNERNSFSRKISEYGQIQKHISDSYSNFMAGRAYMYSIANRMELESYDNRLDTDAVKLFCTSMAKNVADSSIQVLGGNGYIGDYRVEQLWRDAKLLEIGGGTIESHHKNITKELIKNI